MTKDVVRRPKQKIRTRAQALRHQALTFASETAQLREQLSRSESVRQQMAAALEDARRYTGKLYSALNEPCRVLRLVEYIGPREWVEETVRRAVHGTHRFDNGKSVTGVTLTEYPEVLRIARAAVHTAETTRVPMPPPTQIGLEPETDDPFAPVSPKS